VRRDAATIAGLVLLALAAAAPAGAHVGLDEVGRTLDAEIRRHPDEPEPHVQRARAHLEAREWEAALVQLDHAAAHGAEPAVVGTLRGQAYLGWGRPRRARREFDRVLARRSDAWGTLFLRGRAWIALDNPARAADDFGRAIAHLESPQPEQVLARRDALLALGRRADAVTALDEGIARIGPVATLELAAVDLEVELDRYDAALARLERLSAANPPNPAWLARRGDILVRAGRPAAAREAWSDAVTLIEKRPPGRRAAFAGLHQQLNARLAAGATQKRELP
jgi:tetratricopeptide (TPR) repeat protein